MKKPAMKLLAAGIAVAFCQTLSAGTDIFFTPLTGSAPVTAPNSTEELNEPYITPPGVVQTNLTSLDEIENDIAQSVVRVPGLGSSASMFDMVAFDPTGKFIFIPHETLVGAGVSRYDIENDKSEVLFRGDTGGLGGDWSNDWGAFDPSTWTTHGTLFLAEEWSGQGRVMEVLNPMAAPEDIEVRELDSIANVSHEGLRFGNKGKILYFVDEDNSGSIYKLVLHNKNDYTKGGTTYVLKVKGFKGDPSKTYNHASNSGQSRTGKAVWVPLTTKKGKPLTATDLFDNSGTSSSRAGRYAADEKMGTPYGRPEDIEVGKLKNGREVVYFAATSENTVYSIEMTSPDEAKVRVFASETGTPKNVGFDPTTGTLGSPDNLAQDEHGNIYVVEDKPNDDAVGGDVWFARDVDGNGVAESLDHFLSLRADGSEATGMIFNPVKPDEFVIVVMHPDSTDLTKVPNGFGDALWKFDMSGLLDSK